MACRHIQFDINELVHIVASSIASRLCATIRKLLEDQYSKVFLLTMNDKKQVIVKLSNPNVERSHYTIASEVATINFISMISRYNIKG